MNLDHPITTPDEDLLGRASMAREFVRMVLSLRCDQGAVVAVLGRWGSGKTSFLNMARSEIVDKGLTVLKFNPWMFSGTSELVDRFFIEICQQLKRTAGMMELGRQIEKYMRTFPGLIGGTSRLISKALQGGDLRATVEKTLMKLDKPIVVYVDDIDRLSAAEIRDVFRLVRLTGCFPNVLYLLAFDRQRAEDALTEEGLPGRDYLEKIVQWSVDLPEIPAVLLQQAVLAAIEDALDDVASTGELDHEAWAAIFDDIVRPLIGNMRDVRRYAVAVRAAASGLGGNVQLADILGLEAIRTFLPHVFRGLHRLTGILTRPQGVVVDAEMRHEEYKRELEVLVKEGRTQQGIVKAMLTHHFPATGQYLGNMAYGPDWDGTWLRQKRVAHHSVLSFYLERFENDGMTAFRNAEAAYLCMADAGAFEACLRSVDPKKVEDVIRSLEHFEGDFRPEHVVPGTTVLLNYLKELPKRQRGFLDFGSEVTVSRVVYRLVQSISGEEEVARAVAAVLPQLGTLAGRLRLIEMVGHRERVGHRLVSAECATRLERQWRCEVRQTPSGYLINEPDLLRVLSTVETERQACEPEIELEFSPALTIAILKSAVSEALHSKGRLVNREQRLAWDMLVRVFGGEANLVQRIGELDAADDDQELVDLARRYAAGWRPPEFGVD